MSDDDTRLSWGLIGGFIFSMALIVVPFVLWITNTFMPQLMLGMFIGASVRFGTDMGLSLMSNGDAENLGSYASTHMPLVAGLTLLQLGTLVGAAVWWFFTGSILGAGIVVAMLASYAYGVVLFISGGSGSDAEPDDDDGWRFDLDDVSE